MVCGDEQSAGRRQADRDLDGSGIAQAGGRHPDIRACESCAGHDAGLHLGEFASGRQRYPGCAPQSRGTGCASRTGGNGQAFGATGFVAYRAAACADGTGAGREQAAIARACSARTGDALRLHVPRHCGHSSVADHVDRRHRAKPGGAIAATDPPDSQSRRVIAAKSAKSARKPFTRDARRRNGSEER